MTRRLQLLLELDELKIDTTTTREITETLRKLIYLDGDEKNRIAEADRTYKAVVLRDVGFGETKTICYI